MSAELFALTGIAQGIDKGLQRLEERNQREEDRKLDLRKIEAAERQASNEDKFDELKLGIAKATLKNQEAVFGLRQEVSLLNRQGKSVDISKDKADIIVKGSAQITKIRKNKDLAVRRMNVLIDGRSLEDLDEDEKVQFESLKNSIDESDDQINRIKSTQDQAASGQAPTRRPINDTARLNPRFRQADDGLDIFAGVLIKVGSMPNNPSDFMKKYFETNKDNLRSLSKTELNLLGISIREKFPSYLDLKQSGG